MTKSEQWRRGRLYDWPAIAADRREHPHKWRLMLVDVPKRTATSVRLRRSPELRFTDGRLEAKVANEYTTSDGQERCDLFLRFIPTEGGA